jgi:hypothetical protein
MGLKYTFNMLEFCALLLNSEFCMSANMNEILHGMVADGQYDLTPFQVAAIIEYAERGMTGEKMPDFSVQLLGSAAAGSRGKLEKVTDRSTARRLLAECGASGAAHIETVRWVADAKPIYQDWELFRAIVIAGRIVNMNSISIDYGKELDYIIGACRGARAHFLGSTRDGSIRFDQSVQPSIRKAFFEYVSHDLAERRAADSANELSFWS